MISAQQAANIAKNPREQQLKRINSLIETAANQGWSCCSTAMSISDDAIEHLKSLNYSVSLDEDETGRGHSFWVISWRSFM